MIIQSYDWYKKNNFHGIVICGLLHFNSMRTSWCEKVMTIAFADSKGLYRMREDDGCFLWNDEMIEGLAGEETLILNGKEIIAALEDIELPTGSTTIWDLPDGYEFRDENDNVIEAKQIVLEKKRPKYPQSYEECCKLLNIIMEIEVDSESYNPMLGDYELNLDTKIENFRRLLICRDAYWKIAGEEMGLGKPWEPDWNNDSQFKYIIICRRGNVNKDTYTAKNCILAFPTSEMRDAFYENFKELIEECKELL